MARPVLLDLFSGAGGAAVGYHRAGFDVVGVDINPQPRYPFEFVQADAMTYPLDEFDAIHASPPCQDHSRLAILQEESHGTSWMLAAIRERLNRAGVPYVIENVVGALLLNPIRLCGSSFGLGVQRHRLFETHPPLLWSNPCAHYLQPEPIDVTGTGGPASRPPGQRGGIHRKPRSVAHAREVMGIDWAMTRPELSQAIPPAYTEYIGAQLLECLARSAARRPLNG